VFDGQTGNLLRILVSPNEEEAGLFGTVSGAGDVDSDGFDDVIIGAWREDPGSSPGDAGRAYVFDGQTGNLLHTLVSPNEEESGYFGYSVSGAGDVDSDGYDDVVVGASGESPGSSPELAGRAYVFGGQTGNLLHTLVSPNEEEDGRFGYSISGAGDVDGNGYDDLLVGADREDPGASPEDAGRAYVFDCSGVSVEPGNYEPIVTSLQFLGPFPNPTSELAQILVRIPAGGQRIVNLSLYDGSGRLIGRVLNQSVQNENAVSVRWTPEGRISSGIYWWRLSAGDLSVEKSMVIIK
jgi:hypothetical protein